ncbi:MAG: helix-turn-helix domain-containing protein [Candidatus Gracilibacteria bacterium]|jgi:sugar-specific transcriptional regulator TrmB
MIANDLEKLGFTSEEVDAYIALLEIGGGFVSTVAKRAKAHRVTTYNTLENLQKKGYVRATKKGGIRFYYPVNPKVILNQIEDTYKTAKTLIPELIDLQNTSLFKPKIQFFEGEAGIETVFNDILDGEGEVLGYTNFQVAYAIMSKYLREYSEKAFKLRKKHRLLCPNDEFHREFIPANLTERMNAGLLEIFAVNPVQFHFKNLQYIYGDKVATISIDKDEMIGVIIESKNNAETNRSIFNLAWLGATSFVAK